MCTVDSMYQLSKQIVNIQRSKIPQAGQDSPKHVTDMCKTPLNENVKYFWQVLFHYFSLRCNFLQVCLKLLSLPNVLYIEPNLDMCSLLGILQTLRPALPLQLEGPLIFE